MSHGWVCEESNILSSPSRGRTRHIRESEQFADRPVHRGVWPIAVLDIRHIAGRQDFAASPAFVFSVIDLKRGLQKSNSQFAIVASAELASAKSKIYTTVEHRMKIVRLSGKSEKNTSSGYVRRNLSILVSQQVAVATTVLSSSGA